MKPFHPKEDDLIRLWRSEPRLDTTALLHSLAAQNRVRRAQKTVIFALLVLVTLLLGLAEAFGKLESGGVLTFLWVTALSAGGLLQRQAYRARAADISLDTKALLTVMIRRAHRGLTLARCLYAGTPVGALAGWRFTASWNVTPSHLRDVPSGLQATAGASLLILMIVAGIWFARLRRDELKKLQAKWLSLQTPA